MSTPGIHHITCIAGDAQRNVNFYVGLLGMRMVKRSVNQDDPGTYHLFYADAEGSPGTDLTFFPWANAAPGRSGTGLTTEVQLAVPPGSLEWWQKRFADAAVDFESEAVRFGERVLPFSDPDGLRLALAETADERDIITWPESPVPEEYQVRGFHAVRLWESDLARTAEFLTGSMGFTARDEERGWHRFEAGDGGSGTRVEIREVPDEAAGRWGRGSVHHVAWRARDEAYQRELRDAVAAAGRRPTPVIDRFWFQSVYFQEPGGVLFELATDGPGFSIDEAPEALGETLILPPWLESKREAIEAALPEIHLPNTTASR